MSSTVAPDQILSDLSNLWVDLARQAGDDGSTGVLRACTMTLIVLAEHADDEQSIGETLAQLMPEHPSRAIVIRVTPSAERELASRVFSQCWVSFGERRHICAEEIEITSSATALEEIPLVVLPLTVPDLPVVLWCRGAGLCDLAGFAEISLLATKIVFDSAAFPSARAGFDRLQASLQPARSAGDLAWTRLTHWRELISRIFQNRGMDILAQVSEVKVAYTAASDGKPGPSPLYMAAWLMDALHRAGAKPRLTLEHTSAVERRVELIAPGLHVKVSQCVGRCAEVSVNDVVNQTQLPELSDRALLAEEFGIPGHDPIFEKILSAAAQLALSS